VPFTAGSGDGYDPPNLRRKSVRASVISEPLRVTRSATDDHDREERHDGDDSDQQPRGRGSLGFIGGLARMLGFMKPYHRSLDAQDAEFDARGDL
jgi:hypothetical protein